MLPIMGDERVGGWLGRSYLSLAFWYAVAGSLPVFLAATVEESESGTGRVVDCTGHFGCPTEPDIGAVLQNTALILAPTLLVAVPLCTHLARKWEMPALAGFVAAVTAWMVFCVGGLLYMAAREG
nr:hypothetical protein GCM10020092_058690 [Actinoplanes digitatis]